MAMLSVFCNECGGMFSLRGWIDREDLKNTLYESVMNTISDEQLTELHNNGSIKDMDIKEDKANAHNRYYKEYSAITKTKRRLKQMLS